MKLKQIKTFLFIFVIGLATITGSVVLPDTASAAPQCPAGQEYHASDNACWTKETSAEVQGRCPNGYSREGERCVKYTRENSVPTENGVPLSLSCPSGTVYHSTDNKCWKEDDMGAARDCTGKNPNGCRPCPSGQTQRDGRCIKYTETNENPVLASQGPMSEEEKVAARDAVFEECKASGKSDDECNSQADEARQQCEQKVAFNNADYSECMQDKATQAAIDACQETGKSEAECKEEVAARQAGRDSTGKNCGEAETVLIVCSGTGVGAIGDVLRVFITVLSVLIGVSAVGGLAWASVLYAKAQDSEGDTKEAKELIRNIVIGLLVYGFLIAIINWLVPGGVIG